MASFSDPHLPVAVAASFTPAGPTAAGKHGVGLLSVAGADNEAFERTWGWVEEAAAESGRPVSRENWSVVVPIHIADSKEEALQDIRAGYARRAYFGDRKDMSRPATGALFGANAGSLEEAVERGAIIAGSPDDAIQQVEILQERSGGIGGILGLAHEWASTEKTWRSYELWMRYVAPRFQGQYETVVEARDWVEDAMGRVFGGLDKAFEKAFKDAGKEIPEQVQRGIEAMRRQRAEREAAARD
jgi:limonene 1,2-monooxygenase